MYLIIASQVDEDARALLSHFPRGAARLLIPRDLSRPGWQVLSTDPATAQGVAGGSKFNSAALTGVLTLLPAIWPPELVHIARDDREYVAAEMTAFLKYWLATLPCPVINYPTAGSLAGPNWRQEQWWYTAREAGLPVTPYSRGTGPPISDADESNSQVEITLVGGRCEAGANSELATMASLLAEEAGLALLSVMFTHHKRRGYVFAGANPIPKLSGPGIVRLLVDHFAYKEDSG